MKIFVLILLLIFAACIVFFIMYFFDDTDYCLDTNICQEGYKINTEYGLVEINKQNCLKYGWVWFESAKACDIND